VLAVLGFVHKGKVVLFVLESQRPGRSESVHEAQQQAMAVSHESLECSRRVALERLRHMSAAASKG
jgi:hypothetical protein